MKKANKSNVTYISSMSYQEALWGTISNFVNSVNSSGALMVLRNWRSPERISLNEVYVKLPHGVLVHPRANMSSWSVVQSFIERLSDFAKIMNVDIYVSTWINTLSRAAELERGVKCN